MVVGVFAACSITQAFRKEATFDKTVSNQRLYAQLVLLLILAFGVVRLATTTAKHDPSVDVKRCTMVFYP